MTRYRYASRARNAGVSVYDHAPGAIMLAAGSAYPPALPDVSHEAAAAASEFTAEGMQYGPLMGLDDLREAIVAYVAEDDVRCGPENVLVANGAKHATDLACRVFTEPGDRIIVTAPTYMTTLQNFRHHGLNLMDIPQDEEGMRADLLERRLETLAANGEPMPKLLFDVPDFHNPTGITMSLARRKALLALAARFDFVIIEDDPYRRLRFSGEPVPPIKSMDTDGRVIAVGTVSKILAPGLRVGWAIAEPEIVRRMALQKSDGGSSPFNQRIVQMLMRSNKLAEHIDDVSGHMRRHRDILVDALLEAIPGASIRRPDGGYFLWLELPEGVSSEAVARAGIEHGVEVTPGRMCFPGEASDSHLRLAYSYVGPGLLAEGAKRLGRAVEAVRQVGS